MTKKPEEVVAEVPAKKFIGACPTCKAALYQGVFIRGKFENDTGEPFTINDFKPTEMVYQCRNCNSEWAPEQLVVRPLGG